MDRKKFGKDLAGIAVPVALQSLLTCSFAIVDQLMIGQLSETSLAAVGIASRYSSLFLFISGAVTGAAGILFAQYIGMKDDRSLCASFWYAQVLSVMLALFFLVPALFFPETIACLYLQDESVITLAAGYLQIFGISWLFQAPINICSAMLRCIGQARIPMQISVMGILVNTVLNWLLIFGHLQAPALGVKGAAIASTVSVALTCILLVVVFGVQVRRQRLDLHVSLHVRPGQKKQWFAILWPILACETLWVVGENIYAMVYGSMGTSAYTAMSMIGTIVSLMIGLLSGFSQAAGILTGQQLGRKDLPAAETTANALMKRGAVFAGLAGIVTVCISPVYVRLFNVSADVKVTAFWLLAVFALYIPVKTENMILSGGILRSGGKTQYSMWLDVIGTWCVGVPLAVIGASVWHLDIVWVYAILSIEEVIRLGLGLLVFRRGRWAATV